MSDLAPETREEAYFYALANDGTISLTPRTRKEALLKCAIEGRLPEFEPHTRKEAFLHALCMRNANGGSGGGGGEDAERTVVLEENGVNVFFGECTLDNEASFDFIQEGVEYTVVWDGTEYTCVGTLSGNYLSLGGNDEPFTFWYNVGAKESEINVEDDGYYTFMVYQNGASDSLDVEQIDEIVEALFANGDMVVTAPDGKLYKNVTIEKPDTLIPENIAKDVNIAGVVGTHSGGSDSSDLVKYVTFMSCDGSEEYFKMPVLKGDDCKDPVSHGDISKPTKESTNTINYTHNGWSLVTGESADSTALKNVTEDRIVYASFAENVRYYTVNFYTEVGELYETVQVTYGGTAEPSENPTKEGCGFEGWSPSNENITVDTDCYAVWAERITFANGSWADIAAISERGEASQYFKIGDTKTIPLGDEEIELTIAGFDHDNLADGSGKAGITIVSNTVDTKKLYHVWGGSKFWNTCTPRTWLNGTVKEALPSELQSLIKSVKKEYDTNYATATHNISETTDDLFLLSMTEMNLSGPSETGTYAILGDPYDGFISGVIDKKLYNHGASTYVEYWLRQVSRSSSSINICTYFISVDMVQGMGTNLSSTSKKMRFGFCI